MNAIKPAKWDLYTETLHSPDEICAHHLFVRSNAPGARRLLCQGHLPEEDGGVEEAPPDPGGEDYDPDPREDPGFRT